MMFPKNWRSFWKKNNYKPSHNSSFSFLEKTYMPVEHLKIGMHVVELDRPWLETPFLFQGFEIKTQTEIETIKSFCQFVYVDLTSKKANKKIVNDSTVSGINKPSIYFPSTKKISAFEKEITRTQSIYQETGRHVSDFMERIARGEGIDAKLATEAVAECVDSILRSPDAFLWMSQLKHKDEYTAQHSLNVCVLSIVLGRHVNLSEAYLNQVGLCGMMHDMGKMLVPLDILNKPGRLEPEEMDVMKSHASLGYELLRSSSGMYPGAIETAHTHHERLDGKGYPRQINHKLISYYTKIVTIADMYDAITSDRVYQKGRTHLEATSILMDMASSQLDYALVIKFIESIGVYPPGCLVEMTNGAIAIVVEINDKTKLRPKIMLILNEEKIPVPEQVIDLSKMGEDAAGNVYTIKGIIRAENHNIDIRKYYQEGVLQKGFALKQS